MTSASLSIAHLRGGGRPGFDDFVGTRPRRQARPRRFEIDSFRYHPDSGSAIEELDVDYDSTPIDIGFNARYLLDITEQLDSDTVLFKLADPGSPTLVQDRDGASALYVLMPMRV